MTNGIRCTCAFLWTIALTGCGIVSDMAETQKKSEAVAAALEKELGVKPLVGWNINNGSLTNLTVNFPAEPVEKLSVGELNARVRVVVNQQFERPPEQLVVSTFSTQQR